jgi:hypothetical protein
MVSCCEAAEFATGFGLTPVAAFAAGAMPTTTAATVVLMIPAARPILRGRVNLDMPENVRRISADSCVQHR